MKMIVITCFTFILLLYTANAIDVESATGYLAVPIDGNVIIFYHSSTSSLLLYSTHVLDASVAEQIRKLSSGLRIHSPHVDPAGFAFSEKLESISRETKRLSVNEEDWTSFLRVADGALGSIQSVLQRIRELVIKTANGIYTNEIRDIIQGEINLLIQEIDRISKHTEFNTRPVIPDISSTSIGIDRVDVVNDLWNSAGYVDHALGQITKKRALTGAAENRAYIKIDGLNYYFLNTFISQSRVRNADIFWESAVMNENFVMLEVNFTIMNAILTD
jgi:flagellin